MEDAVMMVNPRCANADTEGLIRRMMMMRDRYKGMTSEIEPSDRMAVESDPDHPPIAVMRSSSSWTGSNL